MNSELKNHKEVIKKESLYGQVTLTRLFVAKDIIFRKSKFIECKFRQNISVFCTRAQTQLIKSLRIKLV